MNRIRVFRHWRFGICTESVFGRFRCRYRQAVDMSDPHRNVAYIILGRPSRHHGHRTDGQRGPDRARAGDGHLPEGEPEVGLQREDGRASGLRDRCAPAPPQGELTAPDRRGVPDTERHLAAGQHRRAPLATDPQGHRPRLGDAPHVPKDGGDPDLGAGRRRDSLPATRALLPRHHPRVLHLQAGDSRRRRACPGGAGRR